MGKKVREGYKKTDFGEIPIEWKVKKFRDIFERIVEKNKNNISDNVLTISAQNGLINQEKFFNKSVASKNTSNYFLLKKGDFAYNKSYSVGYPMGAIKRLNSYNKGIVSPLYICFRIKDENINSDFYEQFFEYDLFDKAISGIAQEGARNHGLLNVAVNEFFDLPIIVPTKEEQEKIAEILSTVDEQIENTEKLIQKNQELKKGLMQQLLTKGIGHTEFKKTELGYIPKEWEIKKLKEISEVNPRKDILEDYKLVSFIGMEDIDSDGELINKKVREYVSVKKGYTAFRENDVLLAKITPCFENGKRFLARGLENKIGFGSTEFHVLRASEKINSCYLYYIINSYKFKTLAENNMIGSAGQKRVPTDFVKEYELIVPTKEEQEKIVSILSNIDKKLKQYKNKKYKLEILKKGLMQKLLTGAIKV